MNNINSNLHLTCDFTHDGNGCQFNELSIPILESKKGNFCILHTKNNHMHHVEVLEWVFKYITIKQKVGEAVNLTGISVPCDLDLQGESTSNLVDDYEFIFVDSIIHGDLNLSGSTFHGYFNAEGIEIKGILYCAEAEFREACSFKNAKINAAICYDVLFKNDVSFRCANLGKYASFEGAKFSRKAIFQYASFVGGKILEVPDFNFDTAEFCGETIFDGALGVNNKLEEKFGGISFKGAKFSSRASFRNRKLLDIVDFTEASFQFAPEFNNCELYNNIIFNNTEFYDLRGSIITTKEAGQKIIHSDPAKSYRVLRKHMELAGDVRGQGLFFALEQKCILRQASVPISEKFLSILYWILSDYGNSIFRPIIFLYFITAVSAPIYQQYLIPVQISDISHENAVFFSIQQVVRPFASFTEKGLCKNELHYCIPTEIAYYAAFHSILAMLSITLFIISLRRRFKP